MILISIVLLLSLVVFVVAFVSPRKGTNTQQHSVRLLDVFLQKVRGLPKFWRVVLTKPPVVSQKTIHHSAEAGKVVREKTERTTQKVAENLKKQ